MDPYAPEHPEIGLIDENQGDGLLAVAEQAQGQVRHHVLEPQLFITLAFQNGFSWNVPVSQVGHEGFIGLGTAEIEALDLFTAHFPEKLQLFPGFHTFRQSVDSQGFGHEDDGGDDLFAPGVQVAEKGLVDFDQVEMVIVEQVQGGIGTAEIIHPQLVAAGVEFLQGLEDGA